MMLLVLKRGGANLVPCSCPCCNNINFKKAKKAFIQFQEIKISQIQPNQTTGKISFF
jgi:hypothetical protein